MRLPRFITLHGKSDKGYFEGLRGPPAASLVIGMVWLGTDLNWSGGLALGVAFFITVAAGALMVSRFSYSSFKNISISGRISFTFALALPLAFILIAMNPPVVLFAMALTYATTGPLFSLWRRQRRDSRRTASAGPRQDP